mgnify:CR=1 FL=1
MSKIQKAFDHGKAFIAFLTCGDPDLSTTAKLIRTIADAGADLIELGIPFSDPTAEGPTIQEANLRALSGGVTTDKIFDMVRKVRKNVSIPMVFMTYANVVFSYGTERFLKTAAEIGMDGEIGSIREGKRADLIALDGSLRLRLVVSRGAVACETLPADTQTRILGQIRLARQRRRYRLFLLSGKAGAGCLFHFCGQKGRSIAGTPLI